MLKFNRIGKANINILKGILDKYLKNMKKNKFLTYKSVCSSFKSIILIFCAVLFLSNNTQAQTQTLTDLATYFSGKGTGVATDPYQISTANDLEFLAVTCWIKSDATSGKYFKLMNDIDCSSIPTFLSIGGALRNSSGKDEGTTYSTNSGDNGKYTFRGTFDGNNKTISNITITIPNSGVESKTLVVTNGATNGDYTYIYNLGNKASSTNNTLGNKFTNKCLSLFGAISGAKINNLGTINVTITGGTNTTFANNRAGLVGYMMNNSVITNCYSRNVDCRGGEGTTYYKQNNISDGGLVAWATGTNTINQCYAQNVYVEGGYSGCFGGDLNGTTMTNCYVSGNSSIRNNSTVKSGVFVYQGKIKNCYSTATIVSGSNNMLAIFSDTTNTNNYHLTTGTETSTEKSSATMTAYNFSSTLNDTVYVKDKYQVNDGYPIFAWKHTQVETMIQNGTITENVVIPTTGGVTVGSPLVITPGNSLVDNKNTHTNGAVESRLKVGEWNLYGSVLRSSTIGVLNSNKGYANTTYQHDIAAVAYAYDSNTWNNEYLGVTVGSSEFKTGLGYFVFPLNSITTTGNTTSFTDITNNDVAYNEYIKVKQSGALNKNDISINLTNNGTVGGSGIVTGKWFALSNPFIGRLDVSKLCSTNGLTNVQGGVVYTYNPVKRVWETTTKEIYPGQGFMVASTSNATLLTGKIAFSNQKGYISSPSSKTTTVATPISYITFTSQANNSTKDAYARIDNSADNGFDNNDAYVMLSTNNEDLVEPYFLVDNHAILNNIFKTLPYVVPMNFHASKTSEVKFMASNIPTGVNVYVVDLLNGQETILNNNNIFTFTANQGENNGRFAIKFAENSSSTNDAINDTDKEISVSMYPNPATENTNLFISGTNDNAKVFVCDVQGRTINTYSINKGQASLKIITSNLASGVYYVRVITNNTTKTEKLIIK